MEVERKAKVRYLILSRDIEEKDKRKKKHAIYCHNEKYSVELE